MNFTKAYKWTKIKWSPQTSIKEYICYL